jgi:uncharacterized protein YjbI with pentapeptide repeats
MLSGVLRVAILALLMLTSGLLGVMPADAAPDRLSLKQLQARIEHPIKREGQTFIDLRAVTLDLRDDQADFREQFYQTLQPALQSETTGIGLDFSESVIQGELDISRLSQRIPLYGDALATPLPTAVQAQLKRDLDRLAQLSQFPQAQPMVNPQAIFVFRGPLNLTQATLTGPLTISNTYFLGQVTAQRTTFAQDVNWQDTRFIRPVTFSGAEWQQSANFRRSIFLREAHFDHVQFAGVTSFQQADFREAADFTHARFGGSVSFNRSQWQRNADFTQSQFQGQVSFVKSVFLDPLLLIETRFDAPVIFRQAQFHQLVNLRGAILYEQLDFGDARFSENTAFNVADLEFGAKDVQILGTPGQIGQRFSVPSLTGNETVLRNLVRNFRNLEQIADANQVEYTTQQLRLQQWGRQLKPAITPDLPQRTLVLWKWLGLSLLLLLSSYGTNFGLVLGVGLIAIATFALLYWWLDRCHGLQTHIPSLYEITCMLGGFFSLVILGLSLICRHADAPCLTVISLSLLILPIPLTLSLRFSQQAKTQESAPDFDISYLVQDGSARQLRLLIARLPIIPEFPFFRDRYTPLLLDRRWNWLNYFDFSLNNWLRFGFNDTRLRDQAVPGLITALVWYQWSLGVLYIALLLWTLSRTIPGLNLLLYF